MDPKEFLIQMQNFIDEMQARHFAQDAILKTVISRMAPSDGNRNELLLAMEQQSIHTLKNAGEHYLHNCKPLVEEFFASLQKWEAKQTKAVSPQGSLQ